MSRANPRFRRINPPLPAVGSTNGVVLHRIWGTIDGQLTINTFYYSAAVPAPSAAQLATLVVNIGANLFTSYAACISADWFCTKETLDVVHRNDVNGTSSSVHAGLPGTRPINHVPSEVATVFIRYSAIKGQHGRGRVGLPPTAVSDVNNSKIVSAAMLTALSNMATQMLLSASDGTNTWVPCAIQRAAASPKLVVGSSPITRVAGLTLLGTIRRRKIGRGK